MKTGTRTRVPGMRSTWRTVEEGQFDVGVRARCAVDSQLLKLSWGAGCCPMIVTGDADSPAIGARPAVAHPGAAQCAPSGKHLSVISIVSRQPAGVLVLSVLAADFLLLDMPEMLPGGTRVAPRSVRISVGRREAKAEPKRVDGANLMIHCVPHRDSQFVCAFPALVLTTRANPLRLRQALLLVSVNLSHAYTLS